MGSHSLLQEIFPTQGSNPGLLHCRQVLYHLSHQKSLFKKNTAGRCKVGRKTCRLDLRQRGQTKIHRPRKFCLGYLLCMSNGLWVFLFFAQGCTPPTSEPPVRQAWEPLERNLTGDPGSGLARLPLWTPWPHMCLFCRPSSHGPLQGGAG